MKKIAFYIFHKHIRRDNYFELKDQFAQTQFWSKEKMEEYQWRKFKEIISYSYEKVPYYNKLFKENGISPSDIKSKEDAVKIPVLTKQDIIDNYSQLIAQGVEKWRMRTNATSGSTGTNLKFLSDNGTLVKAVLQNRCYEWMDLSLFDKKMHIWGSGWDVKKSKKILSKIKSIIKSNIVLSGYHLTEEQIVQYYQIMKSYNPSLIISYPSILNEIVSTFQKHHFQFTPKAIQIGGEKLMPNQRINIESCFNTKIFDFYGGRDVPMIAQECNVHNGLHIMSEAVYFEVIDENGIPIQDGEGEIVVTDMHNKVMPFIRYKIGDRAKISSRECSCGRGLPMIDEVLGRTFDIIRFPNGNKVSGTFWTILLKTQPGIKNLQVVQKQIDHIQINYVPDNSVQQIDFDSFITKIHEYSGSSLKVTFQKFDTIPLTKAGKLLFIISEIN